jgi:hypothetical protein
MRKPLFVVIAVALVASTAVYAQRTGHIRYKWRDGKGLPHYSDSLTAEAMKYGYDLVNDRGMAVGHVERQLSPAERAAAQQAAADQAALKRAAEERARADLQLINAYPDEAAIKLAQQQELDTIDQQMDTTRINLRSQEKALADLLGRAADLERAKQAVPKYLVDSIARQRNVVTGQRAALEHQQALRDSTQQQSIAELEHYRELKAAQQQP